MDFEMTQSTSSVPGSPPQPSIAITPPRRRSLAAMMLPPLLAFAVGQIFLMLAAHSNGFDPFQRDTWFRSDSGIYLSIATSGYDLHPHTDPAGNNTGTWDGNAGWMPLYPWIIRLIMLAGASPGIAAIGPALLFNLLTLAILWNRFLNEVDTARAFFCLLLATFFPSQIYQHVVFPISLLMFLSILCLDQLLAERWWAAGLAGLLAAMTYATGFLLGPVIVLFFLLPPYLSTTWPKILRRATLLGIFPLLGLGLVCLIDQIAVGAWNAFFLVQAKYGHGLNNPLAILQTQISALLNAPPAMQIFKQNILPQIIVVTALMMAVILWAAIRWPRLQPMDRLLVLFAAAFWIFPLAMGMGVMPLRTHACLLPIIPLARKLPAPVQAALLVGFILLSIQTSKMFFDVTTL